MASYPRMIARAALALAALAGPVPTAAAAGPPAQPAALSHCTDFTVVKAGPNAVILVPSIGGNTRAFTCKLESGDRNAGVFVLQVALRECNFRANIEVDGIYGEHTRNAVIQLQSNRHITVDGVYGPQTGKAMNWPVLAADDFSRVLACSGKFPG